MTTPTESQNSDKSFFQQYKAYIIGGVLAILVLVFLVVPFFAKQGIISSANQKEAALNGQYEINKAQLGTCITKIRETAGVATGEAKQLDKVLTDIVGARYDQPNGPEIAAGKAFSGIVEQYPDMAGLQSSFSNVMIVITGCRTDYQGYQEKLRSMAADFDGWISGSLWNRTFGGGIPNNRLKVTVLDANGSDQVLTGQAALDQMERLITVHDANTAYQTGELTPEDPFGSTNTSGG